MPQITIIGLGTVGSSMGLALRQYMQAAEKPANQFTVVGYDPDAGRKTTTPLKTGTFDRQVGDLAGAVRDSPFVVVAVPTWQVYGIFQALAPLLAPGTTVTDTAPNKRLVLQWAATLLPAGINFVGGHPLPRRVPAPAVLQDEVLDEPPDANLFREAPYCIMPGAGASDAAVNGVIGLAEALGAKPYFTDPLEHDSYQAALHDLPLLSSFALMRLLGTSPAWRDMGPLAGGAFRDATRMASSDPQAARADFVANREHLLGWIERYQAGLQELYDAIAAADPADLERGPGHDLGAALISGRNARTGWLNPNATLTPDERAARDEQRQPHSRSFIRSLFGSFVTDRFPGGNPRDGDPKDGH